MLNDALLAEGIDVEDERTWRPVVRLLHFKDAPFLAVANSTRLQASWDQLVGTDRWFPRPGIGRFPIRFPSSEDPGDTGWHIDNRDRVDGEWRVNVHSRDRALLLLFLLSDVGEADAPTRIRVGSHLDVPTALVQFGQAGTNPDLIRTTWTPDRSEIRADSSAPDAG